MNGGGQVVVSGNKAAVDRARSGLGPTLIESVSLRWRGHAGHDPAKYVPQDLLKEYMEHRDPVKRFTDLLLDQRVITPDDVLLFRYSALTFNGHRIHYDHPYVTGVEGYPGLVMNGELTTLLVYELARAQAQTPLKFVSSRNVRPMFANRPISICGEPAADHKSAKLWTQDDTGALTLSATAEFA